jgi:hypothetical protein
MTDFTLAGHAGSLHARSWLPTRNPSYVVLLCHGLVPYEGTASGWKSLAGRRSKPTSYPAARHEIFNESNKDEVLGDVLSFMHSHLPTRS